MRGNFKWKKDKVVFKPDPKGRWTVKQFPKEPLNLKMYTAGIDPYEK
jgi:hypothetical protein